MKSRWALFLSGKGSTAQAAMDLLGEIDIRLVVSSRELAYGLVHARRMGISSLVLPKKIDWEYLNQLLMNKGIEKIFLLGFMKILPTEFVNKWENRIFNVHPSLLPKYPGLNAMEKSYEQNEQMGVTIHTVTPGMDEGPILLQKKVLRGSEMNFEFMKLRMAFCEQQLIRQAIEIIK